MLQDDVFARLLTFMNVLITGHQGFFTREAMTAIAETTIHNLSSFEETGRAAHQIGTELLACATMGGSYRHAFALSFGPKNGVAGKSWLGRGNTGRDTISK